YLVGIGIMGILLFFVHPISFITYVPVIIAGIVIAVLGNPTKETFLHIRKIAITGVLASIPIIIYLAWAFQDAVFEAVFFSYGSWLRSENPFWWFIGYGAILVFALYGIRHIQFDNHWKSAFFWGWVLAALILTLNPWKGLRFQPALFIPLVILGVNGLKTFIERDGKRWGNFFKINPMMLGVLFLLATLPSSGGVIYQHTLDVTKVSFQSGPYLSQSEIDAIQFLNTFERGVVLSSYKTGNNIAWMTHHIVYLGHWNQTLERGSKEADVQRFYSGGLSLNEMRHFLAEENIAYVFIGPEERLIGNPLLGWGEPIYRSEDILVLQVKH
ncbi:MAG: hypothetical protein U1C71_03505, partial [archaeon]|nr:hypothetical protein [archaeon]